MRYCKRITDRSVEAITECIPDLQTLDLSFCTRITIGSLSTLLEIRGKVVIELRLWHCRPRGLSSQLIRVIQSLRQDCSLSVLDFRDYSLDTVLRRDLLDLHFIESSHLPGFFTREPRWGRTAEQRYMSYFERMYGINRLGS